MSATRRGIAGGLLVAMVAIGMADWTMAQSRRGPQRSEVWGVVKSVNVGAGTITLMTGRGREGAEEKTFTLAKNAEVAIGGGLGRGGLLFKEGKLADLTEGIPIVLTLSGDKKTVDSVLAEGPTVRGQIKSVDTAKKTLTISQPAGRGMEAEEKTFTLAANVEIVVDDGRGHRFSFKEGKPADLVEGALATLRLSIDKKQVQSIMAEGASHHGIIKAVDPAKKSLTLVVRPPRGGDEGEEKFLAVGDKALVVIDDGKGRRLSVKEIKLADVPLGAAATVKLSLDQATVMLLRVEGPTVHGLLKAVDAGKGTITIDIPKGRGEDPEEKTFAVAKGARISMDGIETKLGELKVSENGTMVQIRLALDQKTAQSVMAQERKPR